MTPGDSSSRPGADARPAASITLVCGPPCAGKSTYVHDHAEPGDMVIDADVIAEQLGSPRTHMHHARYRDAAEHQVERILRDLADFGHPDGNVWVIRSLPSTEHRLELADRIHATRIVVLLEDRDVLVERAQSRPNPDATVRLIDWWLSRFTEDDDMRSTTERGYGAPHQAERKRWVDKFEENRITGETIECSARVCLHPSRVIDPDEPWDLGHNVERTAWVGPQHVKCNRTEPQLRDQDETRGRAPKRWVL